MSNVFFVEYHSDIKIFQDLQKKEEITIVALTPEAYYHLHKENIDFKIISDYVSVIERDSYMYVGYEKAKKLCLEWDNIIQDYLKDCFSDKKSFEPASWCYGGLFNFISQWLLYYYTFKKIILSEKANQVFITHDGQNYNLFNPGSMFYNDQSLVYNVLKAIQDQEDLGFSLVTKENTEREYIKRKPKSYFEKTANEVYFNRSLINKKIEKIFRKTKNKIFPSQVNNKMVLLGSLTEIIAAKEYFEKQGTAFIGYHEFLKMVQSDDSPLDINLPKDQLNKSLQEVLGEDADIFIAISDKAVERADNMIKDYIKHYNNAYKVLKNTQPSAILTGAAAKPIINTSLAAARSLGIKTLGFQHGSGYGLSQKNYYIFMFCYRNPEFFMCWGKKSIRLIERSEPKAKIRFVGKMEIKHTGKVFNFKHKKKIVTFVPNISYRGYQDEGYYSTDMHHLRYQIVDILAKYPEYQYVIKAHPKSMFKEFYLDYWFKILPGTEMVELPPLRAVAAESDLLINDFLGTTMIDVMEAEKPLIGLLRPTREQLYPEVEQLARKAFAFTTTEQEFLEKIDYHLKHFNELPYSAKDAKSFINNYVTPTHSDEICRNVQMVLAEQ